MTGKTIGIIVIVLIILAGAWYFLAEPSNNMAGMDMSSGTVSGTPTADGVTVNYTNSGFSPSTLTIADGQSVTWTNNSSENLWVASAPHPLHNGYDGTTLAQHCAAGYAGPTPFDECTMLAPGGSWTFIFNQVGTWAYHNHADDSMEGTVVVTATTSTTAAPMIPAATTTATVSL